MGQTEAKRRKHREYMRQWRKEARHEWSLKRKNAEYQARWRARRKKGIEVGVGVEL
jgi:hypothetical protein